MSTEEYYSLKAKARSAGANRSEFIRLCIRSSVVKQHITSEQMGYIRQLSGMANNVNQIAHKANAAGYSDVHKDASIAHLLLGLLAYWLVSTIRYQLKLQGINQSCSEIVRIMNTQKMVTITIENSKGDTIQIRQGSGSTDDVQKIYKKLKYPANPLPRKKYTCGTLAIFQKIKTQTVRLFWMNSCNV